MTAASADGKKSAKAATKKTLPDVDKPGKSAPAATSKPVIVTNRPLLKDPMMVDETAAAPESKPVKTSIKHTTAPRLQPLQEETPADEPAPETKEASESAAASEPAKQPEPEETPEQPEETAPAAPESEATPEPETKKSSQPPKQEAEAEAEAAEQAKHDAAIQRLVTSKKYELPINAVEKRKTKRVIVLGFLLVVLLVLAWADVAIDAGLVHVEGVRPVTHFFSN